tara:strand:+ start:17469 stop:18389 length:921 start_codon:yes stop_codon:yes gene_type:complete
MKILVMGGTRFVGKSLVQKLLKQNHVIDVFTRGNNPCPSGANLIKGDRNDLSNIIKIKNNSYDCIFDISGRELAQTKLLLENIKDTYRRYVYVSSSGVYKDSFELPLKEDDLLDDKSRHKGKFHTENWLIKNKIPFTSFRPTYIYGPNNYNNLENWFFERIIKLKKIPLPGDGNLITQLGHVSDLTDVMIRCLDFEIAKNNIYNCSGNRSITIKGLILKCVEACNMNISDIELKTFDFKKLDPKARKAFPIRLSHYQTSINKIKNHLKWEPKFDLLGGLIDSYENDYKINTKDGFDPEMDNSLFSS